MSSDSEADWRKAVRAACAAISGADSESATQTETISVRQTAFRSHSPACSASSKVMASGNRRPVPATYRSSYLMRRSP